jgi:hypothetical protein
MFDLQIIGHGNPDNNLESSCTSCKTRFSLFRIIKILASVTRKYDHDPPGQT